MSVLQFFGLAVAAMVAGACCREIKIRLDRRKAARRYDERAERQKRIEELRERFDCRPWERPTSIVGRGDVPREKIAMAVLLIADRDWKTRYGRTRDAGE